MQIRSDTSKAEQGGRDLMQWMQENPTASALGRATADKRLKRCRKAYLRTLKGKTLREKPEGYDAYVKYLAPSESDMLDALKEKSERRWNAFRKVSEVVIFIGALVAVASFIMGLIGL